MRYYKYWDNSVLGQEGQVLLNEPTDNAQSGANSPGIGVPSVDTFATNQNLMDSKGPIKSDLADVGGWRVTNQLLGKTPGERAFNLLDWYGLGYVGNSIISLWAGDAARTGVLWVPFKRMNHWFANMAPWRKREISDKPYSLAEAEKLDLFLDRVREHISASPELVKQTLQNKQKELPEAERLTEEALNKKVSTLFEDNKVSRRDLYRTVRRGRLEHTFEAFNDADKESFFSKYAQEFRSLDNAESSPLAKLSEKATKLGKPAGEHFFDTFAKDAISLKKSRHNAKLMTGFFMLSAGGWALMLPIKWLEDKKAGIVKYFDDRYERKHNLTEAQKETIQARHNELANEPPQTYASVLTARFLSYPLIIASYLALGPAKTEFKGKIESQSWLARVIPGYKGTDHYAGKFAGKTYEAVKDLEITKSAVKRLGANTDIREKNYYDSGSVLHKRYAGMSGEKRLTSIIGDTFTETVYSLWMVTCTFVASRVTAAVLGGKGHTDASGGHSNPVIPVTPVPAIPPAEPQTTPESDGLLASAEPQKPTNRVTTPDALATWMAQQKPAHDRAALPHGTAPARA